MLKLRNKDFASLAVQEHPRCKCLRTAWFWLMINNLSLYKTRKKKQKPGLDKLYSVLPVLTENFPLADLVSETSTGVETTANSSTSLR